MIRRHRLVKDDGTLTRYGRRLADRIPDRSQPREIPNILRNPEFRDPLYHRTRAQRWAARGRRCVAWVAWLVAVAAVGVAGALIAFGVETVVFGSEPVACQEDQPCWDWRTMGNRTRGVCIDGENWLESADGWFERGGRACEAGR